MRPLVLVMGGGGRLGTALAALGARPLLRGDADLLWAEDDLSAALARIAADSARTCLVVNAAALTDVSLCERDPALSAAVNLRGAAAAARACAAARLPLIHVSTDYVFGGGAAPYAPEDAPCPTTAYGRHKAAAEPLALDAGAWVARMSFLPAPFEHPRVFSGVLANREWVESAAARLLRLARAVRLRPGAVPKLLHLVPSGATDLALLVRRRFPEVPAVSVDAALGLPFAYPRDTRLSGAWESSW